MIQRGVPGRLATDVYHGLSGAPGPVFVSEDRYVAMAAAVPHFGDAGGFFWIDTQTGVGLGACLNSGDIFHKVSSCSATHARYFCTLPIDK